MFKVTEQGTELELKFQRKKIKPEFDQESSSNHQFIGNIGTEQLVNDAKGCSHHNLESEPNNPFFQQIHSQKK